MAQLLCQSCELNPKMSQHSSPASVFWPGDALAHCPLPVGIWSKSSSKACTFDNVVLSADPQGRVSRSSWSWQARARQANEKEVALLI